ncbi:hypothetical protein ACQEU3_22315 [Spirillospora sp. CA-253888]
MDYSDLDARLLEPERTHAEQARRALAAGSPADAWASLMGDDPRRAFRHTVACARCKGKGRTGGYSGDPDEWEEDAWSCPPCRSTGDAPDSPVLAEPLEAHVLAVATAPEAAARAETLAREVASLVEPWGIPAAERVVWRVASPAAHRLGAVLDGLPDPAGKLFSLLFTLHWKAELDDVRSGIAFNDPMRASSIPLGTLRAQAAEHAAWEAAAERGYTVPHAIKTYRVDRMLTGHPHAGAPLADLPNPYGPLLGLWRTGFALDQINDGTIVLYARP